MNKKLIGVVVGVIAVFALVIGMSLSKCEEGKKLNLEAESFQSKHWITEVNYKTGSNNGWLPSIGIREFQDGDRVVVDGTFPFENLKKGDMVVFINNSSRLSSKYIIHLIERRYDKDSWVTKGYANKTDDPLPLKKERYLGKATHLLTIDGEKFNLYR